MQIKKKMAVLCSLALFAGVVSPVATDSEAASIKLNKKTATIKVGKTVKLKVKGTKKKVKWSSSKKKVATVSKKGVVKGKKAGKTTITAKVGKKKLKCKVKVENVNKTSGKATTTTPSPTVPPATGESKSNVDSLSTDQLAANVDVMMEKIKSGVLLSVTNRNTVWLASAKINYSLKDSSGTIIETGQRTFYGLKPGSTQKIAETPFYSEEEAARVDVSKSIVSKTVEYSAYAKYTDQSGKTFVTADKTIDGDIAYTLKNSASEKVETKLTIFYYDANKKLVDAETTTVYLNANETKMDTFYVPSTLYDWDEDYENKTYKYSSYEVVAYSYSYMYSYS